MDDRLKIISAVGFEVSRVQKITFWQQGLGSSPANDRIDGSRYISGIIVLKYSAHSEVGRVLEGRFCVPEQGRHSD